MVIVDLSRLKIFPNTKAPTLTIHSANQSTKVIRPKTKLPILVIKALIKKIVSALYLFFVSIRKF